jgi:hypothetical protein
MFGKCPTSASALRVQQQRNAQTREERRPYKFVVHGSVLPQQQSWPLARASPTSPGQSCALVKRRALLSRRKPDDELMVSMLRLFFATAVVIQDQCYANFDSSRYYNGAVPDAGIHSA